MLSPTSIVHTYKFVQGIFKEKEKSLFWAHLQDNGKESFPMFSRGMKLQILPTVSCAKELLIPTSKMQQKDRLFHSAFWGIAILLT
uniref:Uncharacterized protein n=1 Tax=Pyxicephalus adspersus TaxID=30357 RepID=A0AAV3ASZ4_PYXAD|nr:TPA: hypothetical protein GDO54_010126 [Pyxicephalus adspersus]